MATISCPSYEDAGIVVVNTCGFIDSAVEESLQAIGEAMDENGRVVVTGCLRRGFRESPVKVSSQVLAVTGPQAYEEVVGAVHRFLPQDQSRTIRSLTLYRLKVSS